MSDTVDVIVKLPRPPEGMKWESAFSRNIEYGSNARVQVEFVQSSIAPATVMVEMPLGLALEIADSTGTSELEAAVRAALARKPCPVMVGDKAVCGECRRLYKVTMNHRRRCKLTEGHEKDGSAHE